MPGPQKDEHDRIIAAGDMVIYCAGHPAIYGRQPLYFEDKTFAARAAIPAPTHSDSLSIHEDINNCEIIRENKGA